MSAGTMKFELLPKDPYKRVNITSMKGDARVKEHKVKTTDITQMSTSRILLHVLNRHKLFIITFYAIMLTALYLLQGLPIALHHAFR